MIVLPPEVCDEETPVSFHPLYFEPSHFMLKRKAKKKKKTKNDGGQQMRMLISHFMFKMI